MYVIHWCNFRPVLIVLYPPLEMILMIKTWKFFIHDSLQLHRKSTSLQEKGLGRQLWTVVMSAGHRVYWHCSGIKTVREF